MLFLYPIKLDISTRNVVTKVTKITKVLFHKHFSNIRPLLYFIILNLFLNIISFDISAAFDKRPFSW